MKGKVRLEVKVDYAFPVEVDYAPRQARVVSEVLQQLNSFANQMNYLVGGFERGLFVKIFAVITIDEAVAKCETNPSCKVEVTMGKEGCYGGVSWISCNGKDFYYETGKGFFRPNIGGEQRFPAPYEAAKACLFKLEENKKEGK